jgi:hypothetical protein
MEMDDRDAMHVAERQQIPVSCHDEVGTTSHRGLKDLVILRVAAKPNL